MGTSIDMYFHADKDVFTKPTIKQRVTEQLQPVQLTWSSDSSRGHRE